MILLKLPNIKGDIAVGGFEEYFVVSSVSWGVERNFDESGTMGTFDPKLGVPAWTDSIVEVEKSIDQASPDLFLKAVGGGIIGTAELAFIESLEEGNRYYMQFKLDGAAVKGWNFSGSEDDRPTETIQLWYNKLFMEVKYGPNADKAVSRGWSRVEGKQWQG